MQYTSIAPAHPLADFVERFWHIADAPPHFQERIVPSGTVELVFNLREEEFRIYNPAQLNQFKKFSAAIVSGTYRRPFVIDARQHASVVGVHFRPGGAFPFLGVPVIELADIHLDLKTLWGTDALELRERLCAAREPGERFHLLEQALLSHLFRPLNRHYAVNLALHDLSYPRSDLRVRDAVKKTGLCQRRFIEVFAREVGLTPKEFCRVRRFQMTLARLRKNAVPDWTQIFLDCGYFDQSHLIRDFRSFSGLQPTQFLSQQTSGVLENHVPLPS